MASLWQAGPSKTYTDGPCHSPAHSDLRQMSTRTHKGLALESEIWRADLGGGGGLLLAVKRQSEGMRARSSISKSACGGSLNHHRSKSPLLSDL